ncbi:MAG TPA: M1 family aminopeptidase [Bryobacteraceae bacterium]|nr:M1 family aminopeptidase [Bryobacteraceae bacterium]
MSRLAIALLLAAAAARAAGPTAELAQRIADAGLDPDACYRVRDLQFVRGDIRIYFNDGYLIFGKKVDGLRLSAVFSAETDGDAELIVMPPTRSERLSLSEYTKSPNLNEHFRTAVMVFTDETFADLEVRMLQRRDPESSPERGAVLASEWDAVVRNFVQSFQVRLIRDLLSDKREQYGIFYAALKGRTLGNIDIVFDPRSNEQVLVGQLATHNERTFFDIWTRFAARAFRQGQREVAPPDLSVPAYNIEATLEPDFNLRVVTRATVVPAMEGRRALTFDISPQVRISAVRVDGEPAEVFQPESLRSTLIRGTVNETFLVVPAKPLTAGREYQVEFEHAGNVITAAGNQVYFVGARGAWYPNRYSHFSRYDLTFRYPKNLDLVATGKATETRTEGDWKVARFRTDVPVRMAGFNLGEYDKQTVNRGPYTIDVYANRQIEAALAPRRMVIVPSTPGPGPGPPREPRWTVDIQPPSDPSGDATARLERFANEIASALEFMAGHFGAPVLKHVTVSPIPGTFGQGFPGLLYLSTLAYLDPAQRPAAVRDEYARLFYSEILHAHEIAHQWWGNIVTSATPEDDWIMEALANYSALMYVERKKGAGAMTTVLETYRDHLLTKGDSGRSVESAGPIVWGSRLVSSQSPAAWRLITYEKGSWIIHMLRGRLGDARFLEMLGQLRKRYQYKPISTDEFRAFVSEFLPPRSPDPKLEAFFEQFVYSTGVPTLKLAYTVRGTAPQIRVAGSVAQAGVDSDFSAHVPIEIQFAKGKPVIHWVRTSSDPVPFSVIVPQAPAKVVLDPGGSILRK